MPKQCMLDLETLSTANNALILSIGAVMFNAAAEPDEDPILDRFHVGVTYNRPTPQFDISFETVQWWMAEANADARRALSGLEKVDLATALVGFADWYGDHAEMEGDKRVTPLVWGNGATFDNVVLRHAYDAFNIECPWKFWQDRCYRTVKGFRPDIEIGSIYMPAGSTTAHDALYDAERQARHMHEILRRLFDRF